MANDFNVIIRLAKPEDKEEVRQFMRKYFIKDEPNNAYLQIVTDDRPVCQDLEKFALKDFDNGLNIVAEINGKIEAICINTMSERGKEEEEIDITDKQFLKIVNLLYHVDQQVDIFNRYPDANKIFNISILSVNTNLRGKGLAKKLCAEAKKIAKENGATLMEVLCTSYYSAAVSKSLGFQSIYTLNYDDYKVNGEVVLKPGPPHKQVEVFISSV